jgi:hypothetical protein
MVCYLSAEYESNPSEARMTGPTIVETYSFTPDDLRLGERSPGISAFMRIRNGAYSLEAAIRSHIMHFDEIVAVYNRCTDETPDILARLQQEFGERLRIWHYLPDVFPPGSEGHKSTAPGHPQSLVNYYNFALTRTRFTHATKLDDDHIAMGEQAARLVADVRAGRAGQAELACFSGVNLARHAGGCGIPTREPFAGSGDHWIFPVRPDTFFVHDRRFERLQHPGMRRRFWGLSYWHVKYLKPDFGFSNYDLSDNPKSRYARRLVSLEKGVSVGDTRVLASARAPGLVGWLAEHYFPVPDRDRIIADRAAAAHALAAQSLDALTARDPELAPFLVPPGRT